MLTSYELHITSVCKCMCCPLQAWIPYDMQWRNYPTTIWMCSCCTPHCKDWSAIPFNIKAKWRFFFTNCFFFLQKNGIPVIWKLKNVLDVVYLPSYNHWEINFKILLWHHIYTLSKQTHAKKTNVTISIGIASNNQ